MMRDLMTVDHPCLFCEETVTVSVLSRDDETGREAWDHRPMEEHLCADLIALKAERVRSTYKTNSAMRGYGD